MAVSKIQLDGVRREIEESGDKLSIAVEQRAKVLLSSRNNKVLYDTLLTEKVGDLVCIGPGGSFHPAWSTVDKCFEGGVLWSEMLGRSRPADPTIFWDALELLPLPIESSSVQCIYCSHVLEHLSVASVSFSLSEFHRILMPGGVLRIVCPDLELAAAAYDRRDWFFFLEHAAIESQSNSPGAYAAELSAESSRRSFSAYELLRSFSLVCDSRNSFHIERDDAVRFIDRFASAREAVEAACALSDIDLNRKIGRHISCWCYSKLSRFLQDSGFVTVARSSYLQSKSPFMRHRHFFDRTDPHNSVFIEAVKG